MRGFVNEPSYELVGGELAKTRVAAHLTQRELAERLGWLPSTVAKIETGKRRLDLVEFLTIARALEVNPTDLLASIIAELG